MKQPFRAALLVALVLGFSTACQADQTSSDTPQAHPGPTNSIVDVPGIKVGQFQKTGDGYLTGTTVVYAPNRAVAGVDVAGGGPGTRETDLLDPRNLVQRVNAVVLSGGSSYGLISAYGVMDWLQKHNEGYRVGKKESDVVPIVPSAIIFDLDRGGSFRATPTPEFGYKAISTASDSAVKQGTVGAGTGAFAGDLKGGVGSASVVLPNGYVVGALVVVNSAGSTIDAQTCRFYAEGLQLGDEFQLASGPVPGCGQASGADDQAGSELEQMNTTIAVVATNAPLDKAMASRMALRAQDGLAMAIRPIHTLFDGDSVFAMSVGEGDALSPEGHARTLSSVFSAGANTLARAVVQAMLHAESAGGRTSYCAKYAKACK